MPRRIVDGCLGLHHDLILPFLPATKEDAGMLKNTIAFATVLLLVCFCLARADREKTGLNDEGFITTWLVLAPIPLAEGQRGTDAVDKEQLKDEGSLQPKAGDKVRVIGKELVWKEYQAKGYFVDFNDFLGKPTDDSVGYAICYIHAAQEMKDVQLKTGSDDQAKIYLNGKEVFKQEEDRPLEADDDSTYVDLRKGVNVLVFKVVNEKDDWSACARFMDNDGKVIKSLRVSATSK
jgi:hypothetical protein